MLRIELPLPDKRLGKISEAAFTVQLLQYAKLMGWRTAHFRAARTEKGWRTPVQGDGKGFPDLLLIRGPQMLVAELKRAAKKTKLTTEQHEWLYAFERAGVQAYIWTPDDWSAIERVLKRP